MSNILRNFLDLSEERHLLSLKNKIQKQNTVVEKMDKLSILITKKDFLTVLEEDNLSDWQKLDIASVLIKKGEVLLAKKIAQNLINSDDYFTKFDAHTILNYTLPDLGANTK
jgi:hypothetical protein